MTANSKLYFANRHSLNYLVITKKIPLTFPKDLTYRRIYIYTKNTYSTHIYLQITSFLWPNRICWFKFSDTFDLPESVFFSKSSFTSKHINIFSKINSHSQNFAYKTWVCTFFFYLCDKTNRVRQLFSFITQKDNPKSMSITKNSSTLGTSEILKALCDGEKIFTLLITNYC